MPQDLAVRRVRLAGTGIQKQIFFEICFCILNFWTACSGTANKIGKHKNPSTDTQILASIKASSVELASGQSAADTK